MSSERRQHSRFPFNGAVEVRSVGKLQWDTGAVTDISVGGVAFSTPLELHIGDQIRLSFDTLPREFTIEATVRHVSTDGNRFLVGAMA